MTYDVFEFSFSRVTPHRTRVPHFAGPQRHGRVGVGEGRVDSPGEGETSRDVMTVALCEAIFRRQCEGIAQGLPPLAAASQFCRGISRPSASRIGRGEPTSRDLPQACRRSSCEAREQSLPAFFQVNFPFPCFKSLPSRVLLSRGDPQHATDMSFGTLI